MRNERARGVAVIDISARPPPSTKSFLISPQSGHSVRGEEGKRVGAAVFRVRKTNTGMGNNVRTHELQMISVLPSLNPMSNITNRFVLSGY